MKGETPQQTRTRLLEFSVFGLKYGKSEPKTSDNPLTEISAVWAYTPETGKKSDCHSNVVVDVATGTPGRVPVGAADGRDGVSAHSAQPSTDAPTLGRGVRGETGPMAYIRRRIAEIARPP